MVAERFEQLPPHDFEAEKCAIASMMLSGDDRLAFAKIRRLVWGDAFYSADHQIIYRVACDLADAGSPIDATLIRAELSKRGLLSECGGTAYLANILNAVPSAVHGPQYATVVADRAREREGIRVANKLAQRLMQPIGDGGAQEIIQRAITALWKISTSGKQLSIRKLEDVLHDFIEAREGGNAITMPTGYPSLDDNFAGILTRGGYTAVCARPSMGKSTFVRDLLGRRAATGEKVGLIAVEENENKIAGNYVSAQSGIENSKIAYGNWGENEWREVTGAVSRMAAWPLFLTDSAFSLVDIQTAMELLVTQHGCTTIAIDHIHLISNPSDGNDSAERKLNEISQCIKETIKRLKVCGIVAAQLSRPPKTVKYPDPPRMDDVRQSGGIEEHADAMLMLHREDYYRRHDPSWNANGLCQVVIAKNRNGPVGDAVLKAELQYQRFAELPPSSQSYRDPFPMENTL